MAKYTVSNYPRDNLSPKTVGMLDALAANPATANIGVNSGYRDTGHNKKAGGAKGSQHIHGNAVDLDISGLSPSQKKEALDTAVAAGAKGIGIYSSGNSLHIDPRANPTVWGPSPRGKYRGLLKKEWSLIPDWARPTLDAVFGGFNPQQNPGLPETMQVPGQSRASALAPALSPQQQKVANAYTQMGASRALNMQPPSLSPPNLGALRGISRAQAAGTPTAGYNPTAKAAGTPTAGYNTARAAGTPTAGYQPSAPRSLAPNEANLRSNMPGPALSVPSRNAVAAGTPTSGYDTKAKAAGTPTAGYNPTAKAAGTPTAGYNPTAKAAGTPTAGYNPPSPAAVAGALAQRAGLESIKDNDLSQVGPPATRVNHPPNPTVGLPPAFAPPVATVLAPALVTRPPVQNLPIALPAPPVAAPRSRSPYVDMPTAAPALRASDIYSGTVGSALDNTGKNTVSRDANGITSVTNQWGATTATMPDGKQAAYGSLPGISGPNASKIGGAVKGALPSLAGGGIGSLLGGPLGALVGAAIAREMTKPGGLLSGTQSFQTNAFGTINAAKPQSGGAFPNAPSGGYGTGGSMGASFSNNSANGMRSISPAAARDISKGVAGLY